MLEQLEDLYSFLIQQGWSIDDIENTDFELLLSMAEKISEREARKQGKKTPKDRMDLGDFLGGI
ncbi:hypothetical protein [Megamonas sp.]|uniref:hypothetical protein n=1 Tax=Megamonas sp. TaxID=2049033 RepID=UPI002587F2C5|nr:hypothetical protein [Megamonas sp.]